MKTLQKKTDAVLAALKELRVALAAADDVLVEQDCYEDSPILCKQVASMMLAAEVATNAMEHRHVEPYDIDEELGYHYDEEFAAALKLRGGKQ